MSRDLTAPRPRTATSAAPLFVLVLALSAGVLLMHALPPAPFPAEQRPGTAGTVTHGEYDHAGAGAHGGQPAIGAGAGSTAESLASPPASGHDSHERPSCASIDHCLSTPAATKSHAGLPVALVDLGTPAVPAPGIRLPSPTSRAVPPGRTPDRSSLQVWRR